MPKIIRKYNETSLIVRILIGLAIGTVLGLAVPSLPVIPLFGSIFVSALKAIAPILVFVLVISSLAQGTAGFDRRFGFVIFLYLVSTLLAGLVAVAASFLFPLTVKLTGVKEMIEEMSAAPSGVGEVLRNLAVSMVGNPMTALGSANYISILFWAVLLGIIFKKTASAETRHVIADLASAVSTLVVWIINLAPFGIMGLIYETISLSGISIFVDYGNDDGSQHGGNPCRRAFSHRALPDLHTCGLRFLRDCRRLSPADPDGLLPLRHPPGYRYGDGGSGLHHQCDPGLL